MTTDKKPVTVNTLMRKKERKEKIVMLTCYDAAMAKLLDKSAVDVLLVGDSLGMVVQGEDNTLKVTLEEMIYHCRIVSKMARRPMVVGDMPFMSYQVSTEQALINAGRMMKEGGVAAVKLEGPYLDAIAAITRAGIPVMGHLGLTPQSINKFGGFLIQGKTEEAARQIEADAKSLVDAGVFSLVLEGVPAALAKVVTDAVKVPTIGIGAGVDCDGQVLVLNDMLGMDLTFAPKFLKRYANLEEVVGSAVEAYASEVRNKKFPGEENSF